MFGNDPLSSAASASYGTQPARATASSGGPAASWPLAIAAHLLPAAVSYPVALLVEPFLVTRGLPSDFALTVSFAVVLTPIELGVLAVAGWRVTGSLRLSALLSVLAFRNRLPRRAYPVLVAVFLPAVALAALWSGVADPIAVQLHAVLPGWLRPGGQVAAAGTRSVLIAAAVMFVVDGVASPTVEELYFRAFLLPRLPLSGRRAVIVSAALFTVQHYWQPQNWPLIFGLQLVSTSLVVHYRSYRAGIVLHVAANSLGIILATVGALAAAGNP